jgi:transmembrane sensor
MLTQEFRISELIARELRGELSVEEQLELGKWLKRSKGNRLLHQEFADQQKTSFKIRNYQQTDSEALYQLTLQKIRQQSRPLQTSSRRKFWPRIAAAAAAVILLGLPLAMYLSLAPVKVLQTEINYVHDDIPAGGNKAYITLANGQKIQLSSAKTGVVMNGTSISYADQSVVEGYLQALKEGELTISTPLGGQYQVTLSDGTVVFLNAGSALKYPAVFGKSARAVTLTGEAYFEVAKDKARPFTVTSENQRLTVLGTHFNISAYHDEPVTETTLLEGAVQVSPLAASDAETVLLSPGEQSDLRGNNLQLRKADIEEALAWKNGDFIFKEEALESIMRKVSRWYDVQVEFEDEVSKRIILGGMVSRAKNISAILKMIELTKRVKFRVSGRKIIVLNMNN